MVTRFSPGLIFPKAAPAVLSNLTFQGVDNSKSAESGATWSFGSKSIGTAAADRWVVALFQSNSTSQVFSSASLAGVAASLLLKNEAGSRRQWWVAANVPSGTSGSLDITLGATQSQFMAVYWWTLNGNLNTSPFASLSNVNTGSYDPGNLSVSAGGVAMATVASSNNAGSSFSWANTGSVWNIDDTNSIFDTGIHHAARSQAFVAAGSIAFGSVTNLSTTSSESAIALAAV